MSRSYFRGRRVVVRCVPWGWAWEVRANADDRIERDGWAGTARAARREGEVAARQLAQQEQAATLAGETVGSPDA